MGFLNSASEATYSFNADAFRQGLRAAGYTEGQNVVIEYRWANNDYKRLPTLATELAGRKALGLTVPQSLLLRADEVIQ